MTLVPEFLSPILIWRGYIVKITNMNDGQLLETFVKSGSDAAFQSITERHLPLVLGTARRITGNDLLVEEIAQAVFILLARKARSLSSSTVLAGWLYRTTCFVAARSLRAEMRRKQREQEALAMHTQNEPDPAWKNITPQLDEALAKLNETDRNAVLLRYVEQQSVRDVASNLGLGEEAAKKRVARALEKLRHILSRRGVEIGAAALITGLAFEGAQAVANTTAVLKISATALAPSASSPLATQVLSAWRATKLKVGLGLTSGAVAVALLITQTARWEKEQTSSRDQTGSKTHTAQNSSGNSASRNASFPTTMQFGGQTIPVHAVRITVLDALTDKPVHAANVIHSLMWDSSGNPPVPLHTDREGVVTLPVPSWLPGDERMSQFQVFVSATNYAPREIMWLSSTGHVMGLVTNDYTVALEQGIAISGRVVDESGRPIFRAHVGASGSNYRGYSWSSDGTGKVTSAPVVRVEDFSTFDLNVDGQDACVTDRNGRFEMNHYPSDLNRLIVEVLGEDGARRRFRTPQGESLTADELTNVSFKELQNGSAKLILPRGVTIGGVVVDDKGNPVIGATVAEGTQWGNLKILSRTDTDYEGRFWFSNRPPREYILAAKADHHGSASTIVAAKAGMETLRLQLPPEVPLRCRVIDEQGQAIPDADVRLPDLNNVGLGLEWNGKTDASGRVSWPGAPTNEVALFFSTSTGRQQLVRLTATTNEQDVVLPDVSDSPGTVSVSGTVSDKITGAPVDKFTVKVCHDRSYNAPRGTAKTAEGSHGQFQLQTSQSEVAVGNYAYWCLLIEADGYEPMATRSYEYYEGDQQLAVQLTPGGTIEGIVLTPNGEPAAAAQCAVPVDGDTVTSSQPGNLLAREKKALVKSDAQGHFKVSKPLNAKYLVIFHDSGWAVQSITESSQQKEIHLQPWARIEGEVSSGESPVANDSVGIQNLRFNDPSNPICLLQTAMTDGGGHFVFEKVPAGEYQVAFEPGVWRRMGAEVVKTLQTAVQVSAGETNHLRLATTDGRSVVAKIELPQLPKPINWTDCLATLTRDIPAPTFPNRGNFVREDSYMSARRDYVNDPVVLRSLREAQTYIGSVTPDGSVTFQDVPPDNYILEVKVLSQDNAQRFSEYKAIASVRENVLIEPDKNETPEPARLGTFTLETR